MPVADITVVFPYYNESRTLPQTLELVSGQTLMPREVIFVNSSSTDDSSTLLDRWIQENQSRFETRFHNVFERTNTPSSSKNVGIKRASTTWIAFMDCGLIFPRDWLEKQWDYARAHPEVDVVSGGCILSGQGLVDVSGVAQTYGYKKFQPAIPSTLTKKAVFDKTGLFMENRRAGYDFAWPLLFRDWGIKRGINKEVIVRYMGINYGDSLIRIFRKNIAYAAPTVGIRHYYIPYYYMVALLIFLASGIWRPASLWFFLVAYLLFRGYFYPLRKSADRWGLIKESKWTFLSLPLLAVVIDAGRTLGILKGFILGPTSARPN